MTAREEINQMVKKAQVWTLSGLNLQSSAFMPGSDVPRSVYGLPTREFLKYWDRRAQNSPLRKMKPVDYFARYKGRAAGAPPVPAKAPLLQAGNTAAPAASGTAGDLTARRQAVVMPKGTGIKGSGWTGREVVQGGSAPASRVDHSAVRPYKAWQNASDPRFANPASIAGLKSMQMQSRMDAEGAAYDEILKRLMAKGGDRQINMRNARLLAPLVAENYRRQADGTWKSVSPSGRTQATQLARRLTPSVSNMT